MKIDTQSQTDLKPLFSGLRIAKSNDPTVICDEHPEPAACAFCGKTLYWLAPCMNDTVTRWWQPEPCECEEAKADLERKQAAADAEKERERIEAENTRKMERIQRLIGKSGIGRRFQQRTFENFICSTADQRNCFTIAKNYADNFAEHAKDGSGLLMIGSIGTGKTHLAAAIALDLLSKGIPVVFKTSMDMFSDIRATYDTDASEEKVVDTYSTVDLLILDDLGKEKITTWSASMLFSIINARYEKMLPTIITTNLGCKELAATLGDDRTRADAIISRIQETSVAMKMVWNDHRKES